MAASSGAFAREKAAKGKEPAEAQAAQGRKIFTTIKDLMDSIVDPSADVVWGAVGTVVDQEGAHENFPKTQEEWLNVRRASIRIIEGANLLMMPGREAAPPGSKSEAPGVELEPPEITALIRKNRASFDAFARSLQAVGAEAVRASDAQDTASLLEIGGRMQDVCENCHQVFWYPGAKQPGAARRSQQPAKK
jgi:cytochrome c553